jgi:hypothetical protein
MSRSRGAARLLLADRVSVHVTAPVTPTIARTPNVLVITDVALYSFAV